MFNEDHEELLHRVVDGEANAQETEQLHELLQRVPEARAYFEDLQKLSRTLHAVHDVEVPADLQSEIVAWSRKQPASPRLHRDRRRWLTAWGTASWPRRVATFGLGFAAGAALVALFFGLPERSWVDTGAGIGSIGIAPGNERPFDRQLLQVEEATLDAVVRGAGADLVADLTLRASAGGEVTVDFDEHNLGVRGVEQIFGDGESSGVRQMRVDVQPAHIVIQPSAGVPSEAVTYRVVWSRRDDEATALRVSLRVAQQLAEGVLRAGPGRANGTQESGGL